MNGSECEFGLCQQGAQTPGGVCTISCGGSGNCSSGSSCVVLDFGWLCMVDCTSDTDCRTDYSCQDIESAPPPSDGTEPMTTRVCLGASSAAAP